MCHQCRHAGENRHPDIDPAEADMTSVLDLYGSAKLSLLDSR